MTRSISWGAVLTCCAVMVCEGIDLVVYGNVIPSLLEDGSMSVDKAAAGNVGSLVFAGMFAGGIAAGRIGLALARNALSSRAWSVSARQPSCRASLPT